MGGRTIQQLVITINCGNAAFGDEPEVEVARILRDLATKLENNGMVSTPCMDVNGNQVGNLEVEE